MALVGGTAGAQGVSQMRIAPPDGSVFGTALVAARNTESLFA
jgi:hypothetical protein